MAKKILCFVSSKGGSGKTTTASALGTFLASIGKRVLMIDTDAATNGMTLLYMNQLLEKKKRSTRESKLTGIFETGEKLDVTPILLAPRLSFVPATFRMTDTERVSVENMDNALSKVIEASGRYDLVILDAQAGADLIARISTRHATEIVVVSEYDPLSVQGMERLKSFAGANLDPSHTWTLFNKVLPEFASFIGDGLSIAKYLPPIPWDADVVRALTRRGLALDMESPNPYTLSIASVVMMIYAGEAIPQLRKWRDTVLNEKIHPISERISELSNEMREITKTRKVASQFANISSNVIAVAATAIGAFSALVSFPDTTSNLSNITMSSLAIVAIVAVTVGITTSIFFDVFRIRSRVTVDSTEFRFARLKAERDRLRTSRDAARSALENLGVDAIHRQPRRPLRPAPLE